MKKQIGNGFVDLIGIVFLVGLIVMTISWFTLAATTKRISDIEAMTKGSELATQRLKESLLKNPEPTWHEASNLQDQIDEILRAETVARITNDYSKLEEIKNAEANEAKKIEQENVIASTPYALLSEQDKKNRLMLYFTVGLFVLFAIAMAAKIIFFSTKHD